MASKSTKTVETAFSPIPAQSSHLFKVNAGIEAVHALGTAGCIDSYVITRLGFGGGAGGDGLDVEECYALEILLQASLALRQSAGEA